MDIQKIKNQLSISEHPVGLGGCKSHGITLRCCEYNITVFDNVKTKDEIHIIDGEAVRIHHGSLSESNPDVLQKYDSMTVMFDNDWSLKIFLSKIKEKSDTIRQSCIKGCLVDAASFAISAKQGIHTDPFAPAWLKCAAYFISDALVLLSLKQRSPTHMLEFIRNLTKNKTNEFSTVAEAIGLERATPSLLERMVKSTIGFSDMTEANDHSKIIFRKYQYLVENSLLTDCYFYLGYINKKNIVSIRDLIHKKPEMIHVVKVAFDFENDPIRIEQQAKSIHALANDLIQSLQKYD